MRCLPPLHLVQAPEQRHNRRRDAAKGHGDQRNDGVLLDMERVAVVSIVRLDPACARAVVTIND
jgi:hypothetical protein